MTLPSPILAEIMSYLNLSELLNISQVSRKFYTLANSQPLYKREFLRLWIGLPASDQRIVSNWKSLCLAGIKAKAGWRNLPDSLFTEAELGLLYDELINALKEPPFVMPALRRDIFNMPTLSQDFLANPEDQFYQDPDLEYFSDDIRSYLQQNSSELYFLTPLSDIIRIRWNIKKDKERFSIGSEMTESSESPSNFLIHFYKYIKKVIKLYCIGVNLHILEADEPLTAYADCWENYSNACRKINSLFLPVTDLINEFYEANYQSESCPKTCFFKVMNSIWRKFVFEPCKDLICGKVVEEIYALYMGGDSFFAQSRRIVEALADLSLTELNVFFKFHSMLALEGPYSYLNAKVVKFVEEAGFHEVVAEVFLPVTARQAKQAYMQRVGSIDMASIPHNFEKNENDLMIEFSAQNHGINMNYNNTEIASFSQCKEHKLLDVINLLENYKIMYI